VIDRYNRLKAGRYLCLRAISRQELLPNYQEKFARARVPRIYLSRQLLAPRFIKNIYHLIHQTLGLQQAPGLISGDRIFYTQVD
jgi:hypothetical protein